ncbi:MAG: phosphate acetyltransferase [Pseudomonadota bacterium]
MSSALYLLSTEAASGKTALALALFENLAKKVARPAIFRPVTHGGSDDYLVDLLLSRLPEAQRPDPADCFGVTYADRHEDADAARQKILERFRDLKAKFDGILVIGSDYTDVGANTELDHNVAIARDLGTPVVTVISGRENRGSRSSEDIGSAAEHALEHLVEAKLPMISVVANRVSPEEADDVESQLKKVVSDLSLSIPVSVVPELPFLSAPTLSDVSGAIDAKLVSGNEDNMCQVAVHPIVAAMRLPNALQHLKSDALVILAGDRIEMIVAMLAAAKASGFPTPNGVVLSGGFTPDPVTTSLLNDIAGEIPILASNMQTIELATTIASLSGRMQPDSSRKIDAALNHARKWFPAADLVARIATTPTTAVTPLMFSHDVFERAEAAGQHIVLPEGVEPRILHAAERIISRGLASITLLGDPEEVTKIAQNCGADISGAKILDPVNDPLRKRLAESYAEARAHKQVTFDQAWDIVADVSYFGTMMVHLDLADGMVSGSIHTTAHTIRPSFEVIKTAPGTNVVSSVFFMLLPDRALVYGDCAVIPDPTVEQLADIAISSAGSAQMFGVDPRVAMLSYSTGSSGTGADVEKVRSATELVKKRRPDLLVEGPLQYDAAVVPSVAKTKMPGSAVAGHASVLVFPDLNTGNNTYKAVQRSSGAVAVGPVLQGLNKPVNDLSRGSTVDDIIMTIAVTAIQAEAIRSQKTKPE